MKGSATLLLASLTGFGMLLAGCSTLSPQQSAILRAASDRYALITLEMTREELVYALGPPQKEGAHLLVWEVRCDPDDFESLNVELDSGNRAAAIARVHSRFDWAPETYGSTLSGVLQPLGYAQQSSDLWIRSGYQPKEIQRPPRPPGRPGGQHRAARTAQTEQKFFTFSFSHCWVVFKDACLTANIEQVEHMCDRRILDNLSTSSLKEILGNTWKVDRMLLLNRRVFAPYRGHRAAVQAEFELTENGRKHTETMWWLATEKGWKCQNLPFSPSGIPAEIRNPPTALD
jgi:hypothetical protein